ncbi:MAG: single-stranded DNA-binding protein [Oscillospiraceae bacterium]|nr:single-stranded DNA-binding protein [Oscillospiraceae bacterium]
MYNRVILMGRLTADPEMRTTQSGVSMCRIRIAVDRNFVKQGGERQADFISVVCWRQTAEFVTKYFSKGSMILVEGRLQNSDYTDQNGVKHFSMDVVADNVSFTGEKRGNGSGQYGGQSYGGGQSYSGQQYGGQPYGGQQYGGQQYQQPAPQQAPPPPQAAVNNAPQPIEVGDLGDFEEILSDGEVPF